nr:arginase family protein [Liquorilactobacillus satsumensis]
MQNTLKLVIPDWRAGDRPEYYRGGAQLMSMLAPLSDDIKEVTLPLTNPQGQVNKLQNGIHGQEDLIAEVRNIWSTLEQEDPAKIVTIGGNCFVSQVPFDYLHQKYGDKLGIIWIDTHPDVSEPTFYDNEHAMVLGNLLGHGDPELAKEVHNKFNPDSVLMLGLQPLTEDEPAALEKIGLKYKIQDKGFLSTTEVQDWIKQHGFEKVLVHFDLDVLSPDDFRLQYFSEPHATEYPSAHGKMTLKQAAEYLKAIQEASEIVGLTIAEFLPWDIINLQRTFSTLKIVNNK